MSSRRPLMLLSVILVTASVHAADSLGTSPLGPLPDGWVFLPSESIDSWVATFHDRVSGACLTMDAAWPSVVQPVSADRAVVGYANGVRYHRERGRGASCRGGEALSISFFPAGPEPEPIIWNFLAELCSPTQRERVEELLLRHGRFGLAFGRPSPSLRLPTPAQVSAIGQGTPLVEVVAQLGAPPDSRCLARDGFTIGYAVSHGKSYREWDLRFDAGQKFVSAKRRHPGY